MTKNSHSKSKPWEGEPAAHPILATAVVPWAERYEFDADQFREHVGAIATGLTRHIYVFGTAGEGYALTDAQYDRVTKAFWQAAQDFDVRPMVGVVSLSLGTMIERIERSRAMGFREFQISLPSWGALNDRELATFFAETCGRFPDCFFLHYNLGRTKRILTGADYRRIGPAHPNLVAVKKGGSDEPAVIKDLLSVQPGIKMFFTENSYIEARKHALCGLLISVATVNYARAKELVAGDDAFRAACLPELKAMVDKLIELSQGKFHIDGAYDKLLAKVSQPAFPQRLLPPYESSTEADYRAFLAALPARGKP